jgi:hypothetical protein
MNRDFFNPNAAKLIHFGDMHLLALRGFGRSLGVAEQRDARLCAQGAAGSGERL